MPSALADVVYISAGAYSSAAVMSDGRVLMWGRNAFAAPERVNLIALGSQTTIMEWRPLSYTPWSGDIPASGEVQLVNVSFDGIQPGRRYRYTVTARNSIGTVSSTGVFNSRVVRSQIFIPYITSGSEPVSPVGIR